MLDRLLEGVGGEFGARWSAVMLTPAFFFWLGGLIALRYRFGPQQVLQWYTQWQHNAETVLGPGQDLWALAGMVIGLLILVSASSILVGFLATPVVQFLEGYWPAPLSTVRRLFLWLRRDQYDLLGRRAGLWYSLNWRAKNGRLSLSDTEKASCDTQAAKLGRTLRWAEWGPGPWRWVVVWVGVCPVRDLWRYRRLARRGNRRLTWNEWCEYRKLQDKLAVLFARNRTGSQPAPGASRRTSILQDVNSVLKAQAATQTRNRRFVLWMRVRPLPHELWRYWRLARRGRHRLTRDERREYVKRQQDWSAFRAHGLRAKGQVFWRQWTRAREVWYDTYFSLQQLQARERMTAENRRRLEASELDAMFQADWALAHSPEPGELMPTRLGNTLKAAEQRVRHKYGLDPIVCWPRLRLVLPERTARGMAHARNSLDNCAQTWLWCLLFVLFWTWAAWWAALVGLVGAYLAYRALLGAAAAYAEALESVFDLYRRALYESLAWPMPEMPSAERQAGDQLTQALHRLPRDEVLSKLRQSEQTLGEHQSVVQGEHGEE